MSNAKKIIIGIVAVITMIIIALVTLILFLGIMLWGRGGKQDDGKISSDKPEKYEWSYTDPDSKDDSSDDKNDSDNKDDLKEESMAAYRRFLDGTEPVNIKDGEFYTLIEYIEHSYLYSDPETCSCSNVKYGYIDCGADGIPELLLYYEYEDEMSEYEGSYEMEVVIKYIDGRLKQCAVASSHYRSYESFNEYGIMMSGFSDFAGANMYVGVYGVDANGEYVHLMDSQETTADAIPSIYSGNEGEPDFCDAFPYDSDIFLKMTISSTEYFWGKYKGESVYDYHSNGWFSEQDDYTFTDEEITAIEKVFHDAGARLETEEQNQNMDQETIEEFGLTESQFYGDTPEMFDLSI